MLDFPPQDTGPLLVLARSFTWSGALDSGEKPQGIILPYITIYFGHHSCSTYGCTITAGILNLLIISTANSRVFFKAEDNFRFALKAEDNRTNRILKSTFRHVRAGRDPREMGPSVPSSTRLLSEFVSATLDARAQKRTPPCGGYVFWPRPYDNRG